MFWPLLGLLLTLLPQAQTPPTSSDAGAQADAPASSKVWIGHYAEFEKFLQTAPIERSTSTPVGILAPRHVFFAPGGLAASAALKKIPPGRREGYFESYKSEIAAYKLDRLLELDMVPPTVERKIDKEMVSVQLWVDNTRMLKEVKQLKLQDPNTERWNKQLHRTYVFDDLVANIDENEGNLLFDRAWNFIKVDHSRAFTDTLRLPFDVQQRIHQIDRPFFDRIKGLDQAAVRREIGDLLEGGCLPALFSRRDAIVKAFEELAKKNGEAQVFVSWP